MYRQMTVTHFYLRLQHTTSIIKDSSSAFCLNRSVGYAHLVVQTRKPRKSILYLLHKLLTDRHQNHCSDPCSMISRSGHVNC